MGPRFRLGDQVEVVLKGTITKRTEVLDKTEAEYLVRYEVDGRDYYKRFNESELQAGSI